MCNVQALITNGLLLMGESDGEVQPEMLTYEFVPVLIFILSSCTTLKCRVRKEYQVFEKLLQMVPCLAEASDEEFMMAADSVCLTVTLKYLSHAL